MDGSLLDFWGAWWDANGVPNWFVDPCSPAAVSDTPPAGDHQGEKDA